MILMSVLVSRMALTFTMYAVGNGQILFIATAVTTATFLPLLWYYSCFFIVTVVLP